MSRIIDLTGRRIGMLTVLRPAQPEIQYYLPIVEAYDAQNAVSNQSVGDDSNERL